ncbi:MAG: tryptophan synthase subunit alpha [Gammaproteobacteria bacterium]|nr:tryptophan synthase subunit alpha [Gammaproteobacteria bacterium]
MTATRLVRCLAALKGAERKALNTFITAGDPTKAATVPAMHALVRGGADIIELGVPFSDPEADGPAIQLSSERALAEGTTLREVLDMVAAFRTSDTATPVLLMGYLNVLLKMGLAEFASAAGRAGADGVIVVNLPPEEAADVKELLAAQGMDLVLLAAPTTTPERARMIASVASGFLYYVSFRGTTGANLLDPKAVGQSVTRLREATELPILVGFGIRDGDSARRVAALADGVVVGTALVTTMGEAPPDEIPARLEAQVRSLRQALDA